jgi:hypothetical protein
MTEHIRKTLCNAKSLEEVGFRTIEPGTFYANKCSVIFSRRDDSWQVGVVLTNENAVDFDLPLGALDVTVWQDSQSEEASRERAGRPHLFLVPK